MHKWGERIPLDVKAVEDEVYRSNLQIDIPPLALQEPHASLLYFARTSDSYSQEMERMGQGRRTLLLCEETISSGRTSLKL